MLHSTYFLRFSKKVNVMKRILMLSLTVALSALPCVLFVTCSKKSNNEVAFNSIRYNAIKSYATITGTDARECPCCGGYYISIDDHKPVAGQYFLAYNFPGDYKPGKYPVRIYIEWEKDDKACVNDKITIFAIKILSN